jgi:hypothetical protein
LADIVVGLYPYLYYILAVNDSKTVIMAENVSGLWLFYPSMLTLRNFSMPQLIVHFDESERMQHIADTIEDHDFHGGGPPKWFRVYEKMEPG